MSDQSDIHEDDFGGDDILAAEFSLGLLSGEDHAQAARRARTDRAFAELVEDWDIRFSQMTETISPVTPPKNLFRRIAAEAYPDSAKGLWRQLGVLPALLGAGAAALVLLVAVQFGGIGQPDGPIASLGTRMVAEDNSTVVVAAFVEDSDTLFVEWQVGDRGADRDIELWLIAGDAAPVSLGLLNPDTQITEFAIPANLRSLLAGSTLAVSDEPLGGSPTGAPTGDILAIGAVAAI